MNKKYIFHAIGLVLALISLIPPLPGVLKFILALLPLFAYTAEIILLYLKKISKKNFINEYASALLGIVIIICMGKISLAALTVIIFSALTSIYKDATKKSYERIEYYTCVFPKKAKIISNDAFKNIPASQIKSGENVIVKEGDIIPCDGYVLHGAALVDYTNLFGETKPSQAGVGQSCYSGGIIQNGSITIKAANDSQNSLAYSLEQRTKSARRPSPLQEKISLISKIAQIGFIVIGLFLSLIYLIATRDYRYSMNIFAVAAFASSTLVFTKVLPLLYYSSLLNARSSGGMLTSCEALEKLANVQTFAPNENLTHSDIESIEQTGIVAAKSAAGKTDAGLFRNKNSLLTANKDTFKIALGFTTKYADLCILDGNAKKCANIVRTARAARAIFLENTAIFIIGKLLIFALLFLLKLNPVFAVIIDFAVWFACLINSTKYN
ncbi:MAG: hypothetical protein IKU52_07255 [Clostridia bacterium]|nr:hypothetical protein [Clostridia bacterium]